MTTPSLVSIVIATQNRRDVVLSTLEELHKPERIGCDCEIIVVVNPSTDGTADAIRRDFRDVQVIRLEENLGSCAKSVGVDRAGGEYVVFLDDDSYPRPGSVTRMVARFKVDGRLGAAGFVVYLPDGRRECSAFDHVFAGCGVGFRRGALQSVGGLDSALFMQAEEYDLSFRLIAAGWKIKTFADLAVDHLKTSHARLSGRTVYYDTRNNLILTARYLADPHERIFRSDWLKRYRWIAADNGHRLDYWRGRLAGRRRRRREREGYTRWRLSASAFEELFHVDYIAQCIRRLTVEGVGTIILAGLGKNIYPFVDAARLAGLSVTCIADDRFARPGRRYRGHAIVPAKDALARRLDAIVISDTSPVHAEETHRQFTGLTDVPIHRWFGYDVQ